MSALSTIFQGYTFGATELVTNTKLHALVTSAVITDSDMVTYDESVICYSGSTVTY